MIDSMPKKLGEKNNHDVGKKMAICKNWNGVSGNGMKGMMEMQGIRLGMQEIGVGMQGMW